MHTSTHTSGKSPTHDVRIITTTDGVIAHDRDSLRPAEIVRPWSSHDFKVSLSPSPQFTEPSRTSKDDSYAFPNPATPKRTNFPTQGLSLQMPPRDVSSTSTANLSKQVPSSPKYDLSAPWTSPGSAVPRRSRGMDFSRACTNLHHSTLAEQSSPDSSPTIGGRGIFVPQRRSLLNGAAASAVPDSPSAAPHTLWSTLEKPSLSSSLGSVSGMEHESDTSSSSDDENMLHNDEDETIHPKIPPHENSGQVRDSFRAYSFPAAKMMSYQRARSRRPRKNRTLPVHGLDSPPVLRSIESSLRGTQEDPAKSAIQSRRQSLSLGTHDLQLSDCEGSDEASVLTKGSLGLAITTMNPHGDGPANVVRKTVNRRSNMLPKPKNFHRIRAALFDEATPIESEVSREAEVIRQVRESDSAAAAQNSICMTPSQATTTTSSPSLLPTATAGPSDTGSGELSEDITMASEMSAASRRSSSTFSFQATRSTNNLGHWNMADERTRTPPPFPSNGRLARGSSSNLSEDLNLDTPLSSLNSISTPTQPSSTSTKPSDPANNPPTPMSTATITTDFIPKKGNNKRMRDDDWDILHFKRRAVSPGMSLQNSPILPQSPLSSSNHSGHVGWAGQWPKAGGGSGFGGQHHHDVPTASPVVSGSAERISSAGSVSSGSGAGSGLAGTPRRVGLQGMNDTSDGLMSMSIE